jgi:hypothetical protein
MWVRLPTPRNQIAADDKENLDADRMNAIRQKAKRIHMTGQRIGMAKNDHGRRHEAKSVKSAGPVDHFAPHARSADQWNSLKKRR